MTYTPTARMRLPKPDRGTQQAFDLTQYNTMLDLIDTLAGITPVGSLALAPTTNLYDGRVIIARDTRNVYVYNYGLSIWEQANIQQPANLPVNTLAMLTTAQRNALYKPLIVDGTAIFNTTLNKLEVYKVADGKWYDAMANVTYTHPDPVSGVTPNVDFQVIGTPSVTASTANVNQQFGAGRRMDRTSNGVTWLIKLAPNNFEWILSWSADGTTWTDVSLYNCGANSGYLRDSASLFIDVDDYMHIAFKDVNGGNLYYVRGTPNVARTSYAFTGALANPFYSNTQYGGWVDIVAHRDPAVSGGYVVHYIFDGQNNGRHSYYGRYLIAANGALANQGFATALTDASASSTGDLYPSIDFRHTGDGKTIQVQPDIYIMASPGSTGGYSIGLKKIVYSGGTWGSPQTSDVSVVSNRLFNTVAKMSVMYDGTRIICAGMNNVTSSYWTTIAIYDQATLNNLYYYDQPFNTDNSVFSGSPMYDANGNVYLVGSSLNAANGTIRAIKYVRSGNALAASAFNLDTNPNPANPCVTVRRNYNGNKLDAIYLSGSAAPYALKYTSLAGYNGVLGNAQPTVQIATATSNTATVGSNQRKTDRTTNGNIWETYWSSSAGGSYLNVGYSTDNGLTFTATAALYSTTNAFNYTPNSSIYIDLDDYAHLVYKHPIDGFIYYQRGTPNVSRTAYTWSGATAVYSSADAADFPDLIAMRDPAASGAWVVHSVCQYSTTQIMWYRLNITSAGAITVTNMGNISSTSNVGRPSIELKHTGDGKTAAASPDVYVCWSGSALATGIRYRKLAYSGGAWSAGTEVVVDNAHYFTGASECATILFDGTRCVIAGVVYTGSQYDLIAHDVNVTDNTFTTRTLLTNVVAGNSGVDCIIGQFTYDYLGNIWFVGRSAESTAKLNVRKWTRASGTLGSITTVGNLANNNPYISVRRTHKVIGGFADTIDYVYTDNSSAPFSVRYGRVA